MIEHNDNTEMFFYRYAGEDTAPALSGNWKIMIVDDEQEIHDMTRLALKHFVYDGKSLEFISAYSGTEANRLIEEHPDTAVILLDVVMEEDNSGLLVTKHIREELKNNLVRIILRTGQPGQAPKHDVIVQYDINDYREKTELTSEKFDITMLLALRTYRAIINLENGKRGLERIIAANTKTNSQLTTLLASIRDMISIKDVRGRFVLINNAFKEFIGLDEHEIIGRTYDNFFPRPFAAKERDSDREVLETLKSVQIEHKISGREGDTYLETIKNPIFTDSGEVFGLVSVSRDITERKTLELELRQSRDEYRIGFRAIVENSQDMIIRIDSDYICRYINPSGALYMMLKSEDFVGKHINQHSSPGLDADLIQNITDLTWETILSRERQEKEMQINGVQWFHAVSVPELDDSNNVVSVIIIAHNITDRKKIEAAMNKNLRLLTKAIETTQVGFTITDADGVIIYTNEAEAAIHGYAVNELIGSNIRMLAPKELSKPLTEEELIAFRVNTDKSTKRWKRESLNARKDGSTFPVQLTSDVVMEDDGTVAAIATSCEDITERKQMEEKIKQHSEHLEKEVRARTSELSRTLTELQQSQEQLVQSAKMASLGVLTAGVAHEINNPLAFVSGNIGNLEKFVQRLFSLLERYDKIESSTEGKSEIEKYKQEINYGYLVSRISPLIVKTKEGTDRIKKIVQDLRNFARLDIADITDMNINESLNTTLELLYHEYKNRIVILREYGEIPMLQCYAAKINQVFMNLLINACQAIEGEGEVKVATAADTEKIEIAITDNGKGIPPEIQTKIFDPFFTTKPVGVGTGLGLSISYKIIKEHLGDIIVDSTVGKGTTFTVRLPLSQSNR
ncbi:PAS domain S-box protein [Candidatus Magnetominusculus dajiuhuensis]|uniref:PAS domain S-box protein n=1 Tax=Candidatus Magnetominusculus dajiuhuensis TaxID=3137712 RepID=UPI003B42D9CB